MNNLDRFRGRVPRPWLCIACQHFELYPLGIPVDPTGDSEDEADALCVPHRARVTEGACVLCARRIPWVALWHDSDIGVCRLCFSVWKSETEAERVEERLRRNYDKDAA